MRKLHFVFATALMVVAHTSTSASTLLVNFSAGDRTDSLGPVESVTAADYQVADASVELNAPVNTLLVTALQNNSPQPVAGVSLNAIVEIGPGGGGPTAGGAFTPTDSTMWGQTPILDSYLFADGNGAGGTASRQVSIKGLGDLVAGTPFTIVAWGVGDNGAGDGQDTLFRANYGNQQQFDTTEFSGPLNETYESFTFVKVAGLDEVQIQYENANAGGPFAQNFGGFGGFSITGTAIPEPASVVLAGLACLALVARRTAAW